MRPSDVLAHRRIVLDRCRNHVQGGLDDDDRAGRGVFEVGPSYRLGQMNL